MGNPVGRGEAKNSSKKLEEPPGQGGVAERSPSLEREPEGRGPGGGAEPEQVRLGRSLGRGITGVGGAESGPIQLGRSLEGPGQEQGPVGVVTPPGRRARGTW